MAKTLAAWPRTTGSVEILTGLGGHGLAAIFPAADDAPGPTVMLRCELDALPLAESPACPWPSRNPSAAHKCGHDGHMAMVCGVARHLAACPPPRGRVILVFQPAEETGTGAAALLADGRFRALDPDWIFALHNLPGHPPWSVLTRAGAFAAGSCGVRIRLEGATSHAAYPEQGHSPDRALARLVTDLINLNSDQGDELALVTITHARLGDPAFGITPGQAEILATIRAQDDAVLRRLKEETSRRAHAAARRWDLAVRVGFEEEFPVTWNDAHAVDMIAAAARELDLDVQDPAESPFRWSEDFGLLTAWRPGAMFGLGAGPDHAPLHSPHYDFPDDLLIPGVMMLEKIIAHAMRAGNPPKPVC